MAATNTLVWRIGDFLTGTLDSGELPVARGGTVNVNLTSTGTAELTIALGELPQSQQNNWKEHFAPIKRFVALIDTSLPWDNMGSVVYAGFINKVSSKIRSGQIRLQAVEMNEYLKTRLVIDAEGTVSDPTETVKFRGSSWGDVQTVIVKRAFSAQGLSPNAPRPPQCVHIPSHKNGNRGKDVLKTDARTYYDVLSEIQEQDSGNGQEWIWIPQFTSSSKSRIKFHFVAGVPKIREHKTINLTLSENTAKFSDYDSTFDSRDLYSRIWIQSRRGDEEEKSGADLTPGAVTASKFPILVERFYSPGVELDAAQLQAQMSAYLKYAGSLEHEVGFSIEEAWNPANWINRIGRRLAITGLNGTLSAGHTGTFRMVGLSFTPGAGTVSVDVVPLADVYPRLPKKNLADAINKTNSLGGNSRSLNDFGGGFGGGIGSPGAPDLPWNPGTGDPGDGGSNWDWGSGGGMPGMNPGDFSNAEWEVGEVTQTSAGGKEFINITQNEGNIFFYIESQNVRSYENDLTGTTPQNVFEANQGFTPHDGGFIKVGSGYLSNGDVEGWGERQTVELTPSIVNAIYQRGFMNGVFFRPEETTDVQGRLTRYHLRQSTLSVGKMVSVGGRVFIPIHMYLQWRGIRRNQSEPPYTSYTYDNSWSVIQRGVAFLVATYTQVNNLTAFTVDPRSFLHMNNTPMYATRAGTWVAFSDGTIVKSCNFASSGNALVTWWNFPPNTARTTNWGGLSVGKLKNGTRMLFLHNSAISIRSTLIPSQDADWIHLDSLGEQQGGVYRTPFTLGGMAFYVRPGEQTSGSAQPLSFYASGEGTNFTPIAQNLSPGYNNGVSNQVLTYDGYAYLPRGSVTSFAPTTLWSVRIRDANTTGGGGGFPGGGDGGDNGGGSDGGGDNGDGGGSGSPLTPNDDELQAIFQDGKIYVASPGAYQGGGTNPRYKVGVVQKPLGNGIGVDKWVEPLSVTTFTELDTTDGTRAFISGETVRVQYVVMTDENNDDLGAFYLEGDLTLTEGATIGPIRSTPQP